MRTRGFNMRKNHRRSCAVCLPCVKERFYPFQKDGPAERLGDILYDLADDALEQYGIHARRVRPHLTLASIRGLHRIM